MFPITTVDTVSADRSRRLEGYRGWSHRRHQPAGPDADDTPRPVEGHRPVGLRHGQTRIQLLAPLTPESTIAKFIGRSGPGLQQLAFRVTDVEAVSATLRERGLRLLYDAPRRGTAGSRVNFVHPKDAGGVLVELVEPSTGH